ncbi:MAG TPA: hypothetical protein VIY96_00585, partial [Thermoanaerobaculia bacterium]
MAGAAVAVADDGTALWTNPAGLARDLRLDVELFGSGVATNRNEFTAIVDRLSSVDFARLRSGQDLDKIPGAVRDLLRLAEPGTGVVGSGVAGGVIGKSGIALGIGDLALAGVYPAIDLVHILPGADPASGFVHNTTALSFSGFEAREARLAYSTSFLAKTLLVGGTVRYIRGRTYYLRRGIFDEGSTDPADLARQAL